MQGWVSIHRKIMNNPVWQDPKLLKLWMLCLLEASHKDHEQLVGKQIIKLQPGQFVTGRHSLFAEFNRGAKKADIVPESTLWRWLKFLESYSFVNIKSHTKFSVVTILNWNSYQQNEHQMNSTFDTSDKKVQKSEQKSEQQNMQGYPYVPIDSEFSSNESEQQMNNKWTANEQQMNTNNNGNKGNNENNLNNTTTGSQRIIEFWDANGFGFANTNAKNKLLMYLDEGFDADVILRALEIACNNNKTSYSYVEKVLNDWSKRGLHTIRLVDAAEVEFQKKKQLRTGSYKKPIRQEKTPEWFEENPYNAPGKKEQEVDEAKKQAIMDKLNQFRK